jgi:hypothetical protein
MLDITTIAALGLVVATISVAVASVFSAQASLRLAKSSETLEQLTKAQNELTKTQNDIIIRPRIAIRRAYRKTSMGKTYVMVENIGMGPAVNVIVTVKWGNTSSIMPKGVNEHYLLGIGDSRIVPFDIAESVKTIDEIHVDFRDLLERDMLPVTTQNRKIHLQGTLSKE